MPDEVWGIILNYVELKDLRKVARVNTMFGKHARSGHPDTHLFSDFLARCISNLVDNVENGKLRVPAICERLRVVCADFTVALGATH